MKTRRSSISDETLCLPRIQIPHDADDTTPPESVPVQPSFSEVLRNTSYIESPEMVKFVGPMECESVVDCLHRRIYILSNVHVHHNGHLKVLEECADN